MPELPPVSNETLYDFVLPGPKISKEQYLKELDTLKKDSKIYKKKLERGLNENNTIIGKI